MTPDEAKLIHRRRRTYFKLIQERDRQKARQLVREMQEIDATLAQVRARQEETK